MTSTAFQASEYVIRDPSDLAGFFVGVSPFLLFVVILILLVVALRKQDVGASVSYPCAIIAIATFTLLANIFYLTLTIGEILTLPRLDSLGLGAIGFRVADRLRMFAWIVPVVMLSYLVAFMLWRRGRSNANSQTKTNAGG